jgi:surface protein
MRRVEIAVADTGIETTLFSNQQLWFEQEEDSLMIFALSFLDVKSLLQKEMVSKTWRKLSKLTIRNKCCGRSKAFQSKQELKDAITKYCRYEAASMEEIAGTYGYPMDNWDVSEMTDMSYLFEDMDSFNEYIGSWDVSNVTNMRKMFHKATAFNQAIGNWDTSNATDMSYMFLAATAFNQKIGSWVTSNVTDIGFMFFGARAFNQEIDSWDTSNVKCITGMFIGPTAFNQSIGSWHTSNVTDMSCMFY